MTRRLTLACLLSLTIASVSSSGRAQDPDSIRFTLSDRSENSAEIRAEFKSENRAHGDNNWSTSLMPSDLIGLEMSTFHGGGSQPLHFAIVREAGRLDCSGAGGSNAASGDCRFTADPTFLRLLATRGIGRPTEREALGLMAVNARRDVIDAVAAAHYPTPSIDNLTALAALGVDGRYVAGMSRAGVMPKSIPSLIEFKALGITPDWIAGFSRVGYANLPGDGLVQMRALGVTPDYVAGFQRIGYRNLPVDTLVQLKALNITPDFVSAVVRAGEPMPPVSHLVELKMFDHR